MVAFKLWAMTVAVVGVVVALVVFALSRLGKVADKGEQPPTR
jgi:mannose/fructose/N-acetylgalactosamine-specific phosphotransferase system component IIC